MEVFISAFATDRETLGVFFGFGTSTTLPAGITAVAGARPRPPRPDLPAPARCRRAHAARVAFVAPARPPRACPPRGTRVYVRLSPSCRRRSRQQNCLVAAALALSGAASLATGAKRRRARLRRRRRRLRRPRRRPRSRGAGGGEKPRGVRRRARRRRARARASRWRRGFPARTAARRRPPPSPTAARGVLARAPLPHFISVAKIARACSTRLSPRSRSLDSFAPARRARRALRGARRDVLGAPRLSAPSARSFSASRGDLGGRSDLVDLRGGARRVRLRARSRPSSRSARLAARPRPRAALAGRAAAAGAARRRGRVVDAALRVFAPGFFEAQASEFEGAASPRVVIAGFIDDFDFTATSARRPFAARGPSPGSDRRRPSRLGARAPLAARCW